MRGMKECMSIAKVEGWAFYRFSVLLIAANIPSCSMA
jgi:hypothetical protein